MSDLYNLFQKIKQRPSLYLVKRSIFQFLSFYDGYIYARQEMGLEPTPEEIDFTGFHDWLQERLQARTTMSWASIILFRSVDERDALENFFELLEEFKKRNDKALNIQIQVIERIRKVINEPTKEIELENSLIKDLNFNSEGLCADFILGIQEDLKVEVPVEEWEKISTVKDVIDLLKKYQNID